MENESEKELDVATPTEVEEESTDNNSIDEEVFTDSSNDDNSNSLEDGDSQSNDSGQAESEEEKEPVKETQSKEERAKFAQARREKEQEDKRIQEAYNKGKLEAFKGKLNPFTNTVIQDEKDVEVYEGMYQLSQDGKDPIADYAGYKAQKEREAEILAKKQKDIEEQAAKDVEDFNAKYPNVNLTDLFNDSSFSDYMEGKNKSLIEIYEGFNKLKNSFRSESIAQAKQTIANSKATPGSLNSQQENIVDYEKMSTEDFLKEVERVKNGL